MNVQVEDVSSIKKKLSFEVPVEKVDAEIDKAYKRIAKTAKVKGFRPGKVPRSVLEKYYESQMQEQVLNRLINDTWFKALVDNRIPAISDPQIVDSGALEQGQPFTYCAEVEIKPEVEVKDYTGLTLKKERFEPDPDLVDQRLEEMRASRSEQKVSKRKMARNGDFVTIDFEGFVDGEAFEGGKAEGHVLELGSGTFIPGFEEQLERMKRGEEKEVEVTFPEAYGNKELAGKPAVFKVILHEIKEKVLPELDDEFAKGFGIDSLDELKEKIDENYRSSETSRVEGDLRERLVSALIERNPIEVPETMIERQLEYMQGNIRNRLQSQGMSMEMLGMTEASFKEMYRDTAVNQVQGTLILEAVARQEGLKVEEAEIDDKLEEIAKMANAPLDAVRKHYAGDEARQGLVHQITEEKAVRFLLDRSTVEEVDAEELKPQETAADNEKE